jgi:hypothetical protein
MPIESIVLPGGVGGVSEGAGAKAGGSDPSARQPPSRTRRSKASWSPGRRRSSRGVVGRTAWVGPSASPGTSRGGDAPTTADARRSPRRVTSSACAIKRMHPRPAREIAVGTSGTRPSLGPSTRAGQSPLCCRRQNVGRWGVRFGIAVGQTCASRKNRHRGFLNGRRAARRAPPLPQGRGRGA